MTPGTTTSEIVRVLYAAGKRLTAKEIFALGNFDYEHTAVNGLSQHSRADDSPVGRERRDDISKAFEYFIKPGADLKPWLESDGKNGHAVDIPEFVPPRSTHAAKDIPASNTPEKNAAAAQPGRDRTAAPSKEGHAAGAATAAAPAKTTTGTVPQSPQTNAGASGGVVSATPTEKPPAAAEKLASPMVLTAFKTEDPEFNAIDVEIDPVFTALVLRLPTEKARWTKAQREAWQHAFSAAADFLYPESR